jgi:hypothetical protein
MGRVEFQLLANQLLMTYSDTLTQYIPREVDIETGELFCKDDPEVLVRIYIEEAYQEGESLEDEESLVATVALKILGHYYPLYA